MPDSITAHSGELARAVRRGLPPPDSPPRRKRPSAQPYDMTGTYRTTAVLGVDMIRLSLPSWPEATTATARRPVDTLAGRAQCTQPPGHRNAVLALRDRLRWRHSVLAFGTSRSWHACGALSP